MPAHEQNHVNDDVLHGVRPGMQLDEAQEQFFNTIWSEPNSLNREAGPPPDVGLQRTNSVRLLLFDGLINPTQHSVLAMRLAHGRGLLKAHIKNEVTQEARDDCETAFLQVVHAAQYLPTNLNRIDQSLRTIAFIDNQRGAELVARQAALNWWDRFKGIARATDLPRAVLFSGMAILAGALCMTSLVFGLGILSAPAATVGCTSARLAYETLQSKRALNAEEQIIVQGLVDQVNMILTDFEWSRNPWTATQLRAKVTSERGALSASSLRMQRARGILAFSTSAQNMKARKIDGLYEYFKFADMLVRGEGAAHVALLVKEFLDHIWRDCDWSKPIEARERKKAILQIAKIWLEQVVEENDTFSEPYLYDTAHVLEKVFGEKGIHAAGLRRLAMWACMQTIPPYLLTSVHAWAFSKALLHKKQVERLGTVDENDVAFAHISDNARPSFVITNGWRKDGQYSQSCNCGRKRHTISTIQKAMKDMFATRRDTHPFVPNAFAAIMLQSCLAHITIKGAECCMNDVWAYDPDEEVQRDEAKENGRPGLTVVRRPADLQVCDICAHASAKGGAYLVAHDCYILKDYKQIRFSQRHLSGCALFALQNPVGKGADLELGFFMPDGHKTVDFRSLSRQMPTPKLRDCQSAAPVLEFRTIEEALQEFACGRLEPDIASWSITAQQSISLTAVVQGLYVLGAILPLHVNEFERTEMTLGRELSTTACLTLFEVSLAAKEKARGQRQALSAILAAIEDTLQGGILPRYSTDFKRAMPFRSSQEKIFEMFAAISKHVSWPEASQHPASLSSRPCACFDPSAIVTSSKEQFANVQHRNRPGRLALLFAQLNVPIITRTKCVAGQSLSNSICAP